MDEISKRDKNDAIKKDEENQNLLKDFDQKKHQMTD